MEKNAIGFCGDIKDVMRELENDRKLFGNITLVEYITIKQNIAKYGEAALNFYKQQAYETRLRAIQGSVAQQFGLSTEEFLAQLRG